MISNRLLTDCELGLEFVATLWCNMCFLSLSLSHSLSLAVGRVRVSPSSLQLLVVSFIVWGAGVSVTRSWLWSIRGVLSRPKYNNTGGLSVKIFLIPGFYRPKYQNTGGSPNISPWLFGDNSDKPPVLEKKLINPRY